MIKNYLKGCVSWVGGGGGGKSGPPVQNRVNKTESYGLYLADTL